MKLVRVVWEDACDLDEGPWVDRSAKHSEPVIFHQVGYLCEYTRDAVILTACVGKEQMGTRSRIPYGMVKSIIELTEGLPVKMPRRKAAK